MALAIIIPVNFPGSGLGITCAFQDGQTLSADTAGIDDPNGVGVITYKWKRVDCDDSNNDGNVGTDSPTYTVAATDLTCSIKFTVTYTDGDGFDEELSFTRSPRVSITGIEITSDPDESGPDDDTYIIGDTVAVTVTYSEDMTVSGLPELELNVGAVTGTHSTFPTGPHPPGWCSATTSGRTMRTPTASPSRRTS